MTALFIYGGIMELLTLENLEVVDFKANRNCFIIKKTLNNRCLFICLNNI